MTKDNPDGGKMKYTLLARYGAMRAIGLFSTIIKNLRFGDKCILRTNRGTEWGEVTSEVQRTDLDPAGKPDGTIARRVTANDHEHLRQIEEVEQPKELAFCAKTIEERELPMRLASVEHIFGGEKIIFYFLADGRVDFRQLVKDLAAQYRTRIEMRQIGVRDEARLLAEYEHCGRELCCRTFMKDLEPVTMRMAKLQKTTLDPAKISGRCGRLMCCLRFEDETYCDLKSALPKRGARVKLEEGVGEVVGSEILAQAVTVELPDGKVKKVELSDIQEILQDEASPEPRKRRSGRPDSGADKPKPEAATPSEPDAEGAGEKKAPQPPQTPPGEEREGRRKRGRRRRSRSRSRPSGQEQPRQGKPDVEQEPKEPAPPPSAAPQKEGARDEDADRKAPDAHAENGHNELPTEEWWEDPDGGEE